MVLYGRGVPSIAEQLHTTTKKAQEIKDSVFKGFPAIKEFEKASLKMAEDVGYVTTVCGRKRRLPDLQLPEYEFSWKNGYPKDDDLLDFDSEQKVSTEVPEDIQQKYLRKLSNAYFSQKRRIIDEAAGEGIHIVDNGGKIADAQRQCVNARIQGSAADLTKLAMIELSQNERLKELGFRILIPVHDEIIAECPEENAKECSELLASTMSHAAKEILKMPIRCDVSITKCWYGEEVSI
jgi:DNA polymerase I-like protein with 3'-5' exonuclease and polymerase domains